MRNIVLALIGALLSALVAMPGAQAQTPTCPALSVVPCTIAAAIPATPSTALEASHSFSGAHTLYSLKVTTSTAGGWLLLLNATSKPADGAATPIDCWPVPGINQSLTIAWPTPLALSTGITAVFSTTGCFTQTSSATAFFSAQVQ